VRLKVGSVRCEMWGARRDVREVSCELKGVSGVGGGETYERLQRWAAAVRPKS